VTHSPQRRRRPVVAPVALDAPEIMRLYGTGFHLGRLVLPLSAVKATISSDHNAVSATPDRSESAFVFNAMWAVVLLACGRRFVPTHLALGLVRLNPLRVRPFGVISAARSPSSVPFVRATIDRNRRRVRLHPARYERARCASA
jgi:hypothetical protein